MIVNLITKNSKCAPIPITPIKKRCLSAKSDQIPFCTDCSGMKQLEAESLLLNKILTSNNPKIKDELLDESMSRSFDYLEEVVLEELKVIFEDYFEDMVNCVRSGSTHVNYEESLKGFNNSLNEIGKVLSEYSPKLEILTKKFGLNQPENLTEFPLDLINSQSLSIFESLLKEDYFSIHVFMNFAIFLSVLIVFASYFLVTQKPESEKLSTYECGFEPYEDAKNRFDVQFYVIAILFVLFDIEIIVLLPWCLELSTQSMLGYWSMIEFILELGLGFVYVWSVGALDW